MLPPKTGLVATVRRCPEGDEPVDSLRANHSLTIRMPGLTVGVTCFNRVEMCEDAAAGVTVFLEGYLHDNTAPDRLMSLYASRGESFVATLNGSFALLLVDARRGRALWATDRLATRKWYVRETGDTLEVSSQLRLLAQIPGPLDPTGLAWILSSGVPFHNRTVFQAVRRMGPASYRCATAASSGSDQVYWTRHYTGEYAGRSRERVRAEFADVVVNSVRKCVPRDEPVALSLSAGHDAAGLGGILIRILKARNIHSFSYGLAERHRGSDAWQAHQMARHWGIHHRFLPSHDGRLGEAIERNAQWGDGVSNFCDESLAWQTLLDESEGRVIPVVTGEHGLGVNPVESVEDALKDGHLLTFHHLNAIQKYLPPSTCTSFLAGQHEDIAALLSLHAQPDDMNVFKDWIYMSQRLVFFLLPWRENYAGRAFRVIMPYLENDLLDFTSKLAVPWRVEKKLYKEMIASLLPETFAIRRAVHSGYITDWAAELVREKDRLIEEHLGSGRASALDDFIPPDDIRRLMSVLDQQLGRPFSLNGRMGTAVRRSARKMLGWASPARPSFQVNTTQFLLRYFVLRRFLDIARDDAGA